MSELVNMSVFKYKPKTWSRWERFLLLFKRVSVSTDFANDGDFCGCAFKRMGGKIYVVGYWRYKDGKKVQSQRS